VHLGAVVGQEGVLDGAWAFDGEHLRDEALLFGDVPADPVVEGRWVFEADPGVEGVDWFGGWGRGCGLGGCGQGKDEEEERCERTGVPGVAGVGHRFDRIL